MPDEESGQGGDDSLHPAAVGEETRRRRKRYATAVERNTAPILAVLADVVTVAGRVLEVASGTGQHVVAFAAAFPALSWQPSDPDAEARASVAAWAAESGLANLLPPLDLDVARPGWAVKAGGPYDVIVCINMIHIAPWAACLGLMEGAGALLVPSGALYLYGPYSRNGVHTAASNEAFDRSLRARNPEWGVRDMEEVAAVAAPYGLAWENTVPMPVNNFSLVFRKAAP